MSTTLNILSPSYWSCFHRIGIQCCLLNSMWFLILAMLFRIGYYFPYTFTSPLIRSYISFISLVLWYPAENYYIFLSSFSVQRLHPYYAQSLESNLTNMQIFRFFICLKKRYLQPLTFLYIEIFCIYFRQSVHFRTTFFLLFRETMEYRLSKISSVSQSLTRMDDQFIRFPLSSCAGSLSVILLKGRLNADYYNVNILMRSIAKTCSSVPSRHNQY